MIDITDVAVHATQVVFKNCASFTKYFTKIDGAKMDDAEDLDLVMPTYNLLEYSSNTTYSLWYYSTKDEATNFDNDITNTDHFMSFKCKTKLLGNTVTWSARNEGNGNLKNATIAVPLKYRSNFWRSLEILLAKI